MFKSVGYHLFFIMIGLGSVALTFWQIQRAHRPELNASDPGFQTCFLKDARIVSIWTYERPDRLMGFYYIIETSDRELLGVDGKDWAQKSEKYRIVAPRSELVWLQPKYYAVETQEAFKNLNCLNQEKRVSGVLRPALSERDLLMKRHRHYAYALQWGGIGLASMLYWLGPFLRLNCKKKS